MPSEIRLRFAPSPTGAIHLGNARTALFNFLWARHVGGSFLLRIEDTDRSRSEAQHETSLIADLRWLGLSWEEGPDVGGSRGPYRQSERQPIYDRSLGSLLERGRIYPCFCSAETLAHDRAQQAAQGLPPRYSGRCGRLTRAEGERRLAGGEPAVWRWRVGPARTLVWEDLVYGPRHIEVAELGDFVISRADGRVGFLFANAVDDLEMGVSHVLRGEDHLTNTARQLLIYEGLEAAPPRFGHLPLLVHPGGAPLAKRDGALSVGTLRSRGFLPLAVCNYLARLGHHYADSGLVPLDRLIQAFDLEKIGRARAVLDPAQLAHMQKLALTALGPEAFAVWADGVPGGMDRELAMLVRDNVVEHADLAEWRERLTGTLSLTPRAREVLLSADPVLLRLGQSSAEAGDARSFVERYQSTTPAAAPARQVYPVLRAVLTGTLEGPELARIWSWFSPDRRRKRFAEAERMRLQLQENGGG